MLDSSDKVSALEDNVSKATTATTPTASLTISSNDGSGGTGGSGSNMEFSNSGSSKSAIEITVDVTVETELVENYKLQIASGNSNGSTTLDGPTTIDTVNNTTNPNGVEVLADNTWGYKWNNTGNYKGITTSLVNLESANTSSTNGYKAFFTKPLTFAAKFADNATAGHYSTEVTLSLVATPKVFFEGISTMQDMTPEICEKAAIGDFAILRDDRSYPTATVTGKDGTSTTTQQIPNTYTISKLPDGRCWMTQNLRLTGTNSSTTSITSANSDISGNYSIPKNDKSAFPSSDNTAQAAFLGTDDAGSITGYYTWCAATAGTCSSATSDGANASASICPKGWKLPTGGAGTSTELWKLVRNAGLTISNDSLASTAGGYTIWGTGDLAKFQVSPYNFAYTGYVYNGSYDTPVSYQYGYWWSSTANSANAYNLYIASSLVNPGTNYANGRRLGFAVRCVAEENAKWSNGADSGAIYMQDIKTGTSADSFCSSTLPTHATITLKDKRDENSYTITKMADGKCWMTQNLKIMNKTISSTDSDMASGSFTIPASSTSGFSSDSASNAYLGKDNAGVDTGYYTWCAATAGTCSSNASICPKGWKLPTGGSSGQFQAFTTAESIANSSTGSTKIQGAPYNFAYTGFVSNNSYSAPASHQGGIWWSSTARSSTGAYSPAIDSSSVRPGAYNDNRYYGLAVRCIAQ